MSHRLLPGELVVKRIRWQIDANLLGLIVCKDGSTDKNAKWLVLWSCDDPQKRLRWHIADSLTIVERSLLSELGARCNLAS